MRVIAGFTMLMSTILSIIILFSTSSLAWYAISIIPIIMAYVFSRAIDRYKEKQRIKLEIHTKDKSTEYKKLVNHITQPWDLHEEFPETQPNDEKVHNQIDRQ